METQADQRREQFIGTADRMDILSISRSTVNRLVDRGLPHIWIGSVRRFPLDAALEWLKETYKRS